MSKGKTFAFAVLSGNFRRAVTATSHMEAAKKAVHAHHLDKEDEPLNPGAIFTVYREGESVGDSMCLLTERVMGAAGFSIKEEAQ